MSRRRHRQYRYCAKCGERKEVDSEYVGSCCRSVPGPYRFCAVGGVPYPRPLPATSFIAHLCPDHLSHADVGRGCVTGYASQRVAVGG
jgi:hypothetical protein